MSELMRERVCEHLERLRLLRIKEIFPQVIEQAQANNQPYLDLIDQLLGEEIASKEDRRLRTALKIAGLPFEKTIEEYDLASTRTWISAR